MSGTTVTAIRSPQTNLTVVTDIMEYSNYGALAQAFVMVALESYSAAVAAGAEQEVSTDLYRWVSGKALPMKCCKASGRGLSSC